MVITHTILKRTFGLRVGIESLYLEVIQGIASVPNSLYHVMSLIFIFPK